MRRVGGGSRVNTRILRKDHSTIMIVIMFLSGQVSVRFNICGIMKPDTLLLWVAHLCGTAVNGCAGERGSIPDLR